MTYYRGLWVTTALALLLAVSALLSRASEPDMVAAAGGPQSTRVSLYATEVAGLRTAIARTPSIKICPPTVPRC